MRSLVVVLTLVLLFLLVGCGSESAPIVQITQETTPTPTPVVPKPTPSPAPSPTPSPVVETVPPCSTDSPIPENIQFTPLAEDLPKHIKAFFGTWEGIWDDPKGIPTLAAYLVVVKIEDQQATVRYTFGDAPQYEVKRGGEKAVRTANILPDGKLQFRSGGDFTFWVDPDGTLQGDYINSLGEHSAVTMTRCSFPK